MRRALTKRRNNWRYQADFCARFRHSRSRQERLAPAPGKYMRLARDTSGFRLCMDTKLTSSCQFDWFTTLAETEMHAVNIFVVCHQWLGMNNNSPGSNTKVVGCAFAKSGNFSKSGLSILFISELFCF